MTVAFKELLQAVEPLNMMERDLLYQKLMRVEERELVQRGEQLVEEFDLANVPPQLSYWLLQDVLDALCYQLREYEQRFGLDSKTAYLAANANGQVANGETARWVRLYEAYHRLRSAKQSYDIKSGHLDEPLPTIEITSHQLTLPEVEERLRQFEDKRGMTSAEFYERIQRGEMEDSQETFSWAHAYTIYRHLSNGNGQVTAGAD